MPRRPCPLNFDEPVKVDADLTQAQKGLDEDGYLGTLRKSDAAHRGLLVVVPSWRLGTVKQDLAPVIATGRAGAPGVAIAVIDWAGIGEAAAAHDEDLSALWSALGQFAETVDVPALPGPSTTAALVDGTAAAELRAAWSVACVLGVALHRRAPSVYALQRQKDTNVMAGLSEGGLGVEFDPREPDQPGVWLVQRWTSIPERWPVTAALDTQTLPQGAPRRDELVRALGEVAPSNPLLSNVAAAAGELLWTLIEDVRRAAGGLGQPEERRKQGRVHGRASARRPRMHPRSQLHVLGDQAAGRPRAHRREARAAVQGLTGLDARSALPTWVGAASGRAVTIITTFRSSWRQGQLTSPDDRTSAGAPRVAATESGTASR